MLCLQYGDYDPGVHTPGFLAREELLPKRVSDGEEDDESALERAPTWPRGSMHGAVCVCLLFLPVFDVFALSCFQSVDVFR